MIEPNFQSDPELRKLHALLEPPRGIGTRIVESALRSRAPTQHLRAWLTAGILAVLSVIAVLVVCIRPKESLSPVARIGNSGGVVFASAPLGEEWVVSGAATDQTVAAMVMKKGESR